MRARGNEGSVLHLHSVSNFSNRAVKFCTHADVDIVGRVTVERLLELLLVEEMTDETDGSTEDEQTVESTNLEVLGGLLLGEGTGAGEQIAERGGDSTVDVEDERAGLLGGDGLNGESVVERLVLREVLLDVVDDQCHTEIRVVDTLDLVSDTRDELVGLPHRVDKFSRGKTGVAPAGELSGGSVKSTTESVTDGQQT